MLMLCFLLFIMEMVIKVRDLCRRERLFAPRWEALVMVSGGQDSLALLHMLALGRLGDAGPACVSAIHVNHHLRGEESEADQALVEGFCAGLRVPLEVVHCPVAKQKGNVQEEARGLRRAAGLAAAAARGVSCIAIGHTLDDQVETMLYRITRYGGLRSLRAMAPTDPPWVRPLLEVRRADTSAYCLASAIRFAVDRGNEYPGYARTGIRRHVLPLLEETLPGAVEALGRTAEVAGEACGIVDEAVAAARREAAAGPAALPPGFPAEEGPSLSEVLSARRLLALSPALRRALIHRLLEETVGLGAGRRLVLDIERLLAHAGSGMLSAGGGFAFMKQYDDVWITLETDAGSRRAVAGEAAAGSRRAAGRAGGASSGAVRPDPVVLPLPGAAVFGDVGLTAEYVDGFFAHDPRFEAYLDADSLGPELVVRSVAAGDRMRPLGLGGSRTLKDILIDSGVPRVRRVLVPVIESAGRVVWLGGVSLSEDSRITSRTERLVRLRIHPTNAHFMGDV